MGVVKAMKRSIFALVMLFGLLSHVSAAAAQRSDEAGLSEGALREKRLQEDMKARAARSMEADIEYCNKLQYFEPPDFNNPPDPLAIARKRSKCLRDLYARSCPTPAGWELCSRLMTIVRYSMTLEEEYEFEGRTAPVSTDSFDDEYVEQSEGTEQYQDLLDALELLEQKELEALGEQLE